MSQASQPPYSLRSQWIRGVADVPGIDGRDGKYLDTRSDAKGEEKLEEPTDLVTADDI